MQEYQYKDYIFYITPMDPFKALVLLGDLQRIVLVAIGESIGKDVSQDNEKLQSLTIKDLLCMNIDIGKGLKYFSDSLPGHLLVNHMQTILSPDNISFKKFDMIEAQKLDKARQIEIFTGNVLGMFLLAKKVLEVNFSDFLDEVPTITGITQDKPNENALNFQDY